MSSELLHLSYGARSDQIFVRKSVAVVGFPTVEPTATLRKAGPFQRPERQKTRASTKPEKPRIFTKCASQPKPAISMPLLPLGGRRPPGAKKPIQVGIRGEGLGNPRFEIRTRLILLSLRL